MTIHSGLKETYEIRSLTKEEIPEALALIWDVFYEYVSPDYSEEGTETFRNCLHDEAYLAGIVFYGAFDGKTMTGAVGIRPERRHICFFFVNGKYHRKGIGTKLFQLMIQNYSGGPFTLNSSPYGLPFYENLGFAATDQEQIIDGIRFTPMKYTANTEKKICPCKRVNCLRYGDCTACMEYHHSSRRKPMTYCEKLERKAERRGKK
ncbi:MAG: GNAT family N-acetyltransferase [Clostridiales bacterium]|nr:GNAT family N-acetyltransferase [Clostridiales bacterium]